MCHKVIFHYKNKNCHTSFSNENAKLPVLLRNGQVILLPWGRRKNIASSLPLGGLIQLDEIYMGKLDIFFPRPAKLPIKAFSVRDIADQAKWFHLPCDKWIQGLIAQTNLEKRVYIVTLTPDKDSLFPKWPRILLG